MSDESWPTFTNEDNGAWSATFDSYDQYRDFVYYVVTAQGSSFMVMIALDWAATIKNWESAELVAGLRAAIARVAATGKTNTTYTR